MQGPHKTSEVGAVAPLPHRIEHNGAHAQKFRGYAERSVGVKDRLLAAARLLEEANAQLDNALAELGGPLEHHHT